MILCSAHELAGALSLAFEWRFRNVELTITITITKGRFRQFTCLALSVVSHRDVPAALTSCHPEKTYVAVSYSIVTAYWSILQCAYLVTEALRFTVRVQLAGFSK